MWLSLVALKMTGYNGYSSAKLLRVAEVGKHSRMAFALQGRFHARYNNLRWHKMTEMTDVGFMEESNHQKSGKCVHELSCWVERGVV